jgi:hypothetical protein
MSPTTPTPEKAKAIRDLDRLTDRFEQATSARDDRRDELQAAIVKHLKARSAPVGTISEHTPYDRVHVSRIGKAGDVPPLPRGPQPAYDSATVAAATEELDRLSAALTAAEDAVDKARKALHTGIVKHYAERHIGPSEIAEHVPYNRNHVYRLADEAGVPRIRERAAK